jgi:hypothetical protein
LARFEDKVEKKEEEKSKPFTIKKSRERPSEEAR